MAWYFNVCTLHHSRLYCRQWLLLKKAAESYDTNNCFYTNFITILSILNVFLFCGSVNSENCTIEMLRLSTVSSKFHQNYTSTNYLTKDVCVLIFFSNTLCSLRESPKILQWLSSNVNFKFHLVCIYIYNQKLKKSMKVTFVIKNMQVETFFNVNENLTKFFPAFARR